MDNDNDDESIGNTIRGTNVSQLGHSDRSVQEDNVYMTAVNSGYNRQILVRMENIAFVEGLIGVLPGVVVPVSAGVGTTRLAL